MSIDVRDEVRPTQLYTVAQVAEACQVSEESVLRDIHEGDLVAMNISRGIQRPRWRISEVEYGRYLVRKQHRAPRRR